MAEEFETEWDDFGIHVGPFGFCGTGRAVRYSRTENSHILRLKINRDVKKEEIKVRLVKPGVLEIEWSRRAKGEEIPVE